MKTIKNILAIIGILIFASGCTLMLDEPPADGNDDTPNGDGFTAPRTEQTEFGDVTYQFQDGVRLINEKYVPYIIPAVTTPHWVIPKSYLPRIFPPTFFRSAAIISPPP